MKYIFSLIFLIGFITIGFTQKPTTKFLRHDKFAPNPDGEIEMTLRIEQTYNKYGNITRQEYFYPNAEGKPVSDRKIIQSYDSEGRHLNTLEYNGDNILESENKVYWDEFDNKSKVEHINYTNGKKTSTVVTYQLEYDDQGNKKSEQSFDTNGTPLRGRTWSYNKQDEVIKSVSWVEKRNQPRKETTVTYKRDKNGDLIKSISKEEVNGRIYRKDIQTFNNNFVIRWKKYINGKFQSEFINEYRDSVIIRTTRLNKREIIDPEETNKQVDAKKGKEEIWVTNSEYDAYGNIVITTQSVNDKVTQVTQYSYDDYGNRTKTLKVDKVKNKKEEEILEYDDYGHISKKTILHDDRIISEDIFEYEYFDRQ